MRNLLELINKYNHLILFILLEIFALFLIFQNNQFHKAAFLNSTNTISANSFAIVSNINEYFSLKRSNELLLMENAKLKSLISYKNALIYDIPSHVNLKIGDTIATSGFSYIFPSNIDVGIISQINTENDDKFHNIKITFLEDLKEIKYVNVCKSINKIEKINLEKNTYE